MSRSALRWWPALACLFLFCVSCDDNPCKKGEVCSCTGGNDCYLDCDGDGCIQSCGSMVRCGTVCGNDCTSKCASTNQCTASCDNNCGIECGSTQSCGVLCGAGCTVNCHDSDNCDVEVGDASQIDCVSINSCTVTCRGTCRVYSPNKTPTLNCPKDQPLQELGSGYYSCGNM